MEIKDYIKAYRVISQVMKDNNLKMDNSFRRVQSWFSNYICDNLKDGDTI